ncbi:MAG: N-acetyltransferase [Desulfovibrio sp.]|nr:N-acetyltransferase [Desulfovibrio sp.]
MPYRYTLVRDERTRAALYNRMIVEGLADMAMSEGRKRLDEWMRLTEPRWNRDRLTSLLLTSQDNFGNYHGMAIFSEREYRLWRFDFTSFRIGFDRAVEQARGAFAWIFSHTDASGIYGVTPASNRAALRLAQACGFLKLVRLPLACWLARRGKYVDGMYCICTQQSLEETMGFGTGGGDVSTPEVPATPKAEVTKPVTEAATAARQNQKDKASKAAGLRSTILTGEGLGSSNTQGKTLLGQ